LETGIWVQNWDSKITGAINVRNFEPRWVRFLTGPFLRKEGGHNQGGFKEEMGAPIYWGELMVINRDNVSVGE